MNIFKLKSYNHTEKDNDVLQKMCDLSNEMRMRIDSSNSQTLNSLGKKDRARMRKLISQFLKEENSNQISKEGKITCSGKNTNFIFGMITNNYLESEVA